MAELDPLADALARDAEAIGRRDQALAAAGRLPLPGPLIEAWDPPHCPLAARYGWTVRPAVAGDFIVLQRLDSPLLRLNDPEVVISQEDAVEIVFQFTRSLPEVRSALAAGRQEFRETAARAVADRLLPFDLQPLLIEVRDRFLSWLSTVVSYRETEPDGQRQRDFTPPPAGTGSAGG